MNVSTLTDADFDSQAWLSPSIDKGGTVSVVLFTDGKKAAAGETKKRSEKASDLLQEIATEYGEKVGLKFFEVDYTVNAALAKRYDIQSAPTFLFLQVEEVVGGSIKQEIKAKIDRKLA